MKQFLTVLKAMSDETRLRLIHLLMTQDLCGKALARRLGISEAAVSQHIKVLRDAELVIGEKRGYWTHYTVDREVMETAIREFESMVNEPPAPGSCHLSMARAKGYLGKEVRLMCKPCCEKPEKLKGKPEECTPEQIKECHGDVKEHVCTGEKKETRA